MRVLKRDYAIVLSGGTDLVPKIKRGQIKPQKLISLENIKELNTIKYTNGMLSIGSCAKLQEVVDSKILDNFPAIKTAAALVATIAIRSAASIGGNIFQDTRCIYTDKSVLWRSGKVALRDSFDFPEIGVALGIRNKIRK